MSLPGNLGKYLGQGFLLLASILAASAMLAAQAPPEESLQPELGPALAAPVSDAAKPLRVVTFNVHYALDVPALAASLRANPALREADVFLLQEIESHEKEGSSRTRRLADALGLNYVYAPARYAKDGGRCTHGLAILSRYPISEVEIVPLPRYDLGAKTRRRIAVGATVAVSGQPLRVYNVHLDTRINTADRLAQLQPVLEAARRHPVESVVIGGDFNTNPLRWAFHRLPVFRSTQAAALDNFMQNEGFHAPLTQSGSTSNRSLFKARLDSLYARQLEVKSFQVERSVQSSDHFPVWIEVAWPPAAEEKTRAQKSQAETAKPPEE